MFADPTSVTINGVAKSMPTVSRAATSSVYATADGIFTLKISNQNTKTRERHLARIDQRIVAVDPISTDNFFAELGVYLVIDSPNSGYSDAEIDYVVQGLKGFLTTANVLKILGNET